jgi:competence protein ComEC
VLGVLALLLVGCGESSATDPDLVRGGLGRLDGGDRVASVLRPPCGTGTWRPGRLEIHHLALGQADATLFVGPAGHTLLVDAGEIRYTDSKGAVTIGARLEEVLGKGCRRLDTVLITHFHVDHIGYVGRGGLWHLVKVQGFTVGQLLHRDARLFLGDTSGTYQMWRAFLEGEGAALLGPRLARPGTDQIDLGPGVVARIVAVDGGGQLRPGDFSKDRAPPNENDYSAVLHVRFGRLDYLIAGDLTGETAPGDFGYTYHDVETPVARALPDMDVYRVSHHGSHHSSNPTLLAQIDPEVSIVSCGDGNTYGHPRQPTVDRLLATSALYLTERGEPRTHLGPAKVLGTVVLRTEDGERYTVGGDPFVATDPARRDADMDGYFAEADPDDTDARATPLLQGGCAPTYQTCQ